MRDYIILNGVNSKTITGLLISKLPPITKPKIRTQVEEIDGRDGDIITKLGYSAYDKTIEIGLYGDFDINEVISYFNSEGTVIFSNELDKYYNYEILDQIDYEKLIRFKTAKVKMHIQPYKYPTDEEELEETIELIGGEGTDITLNDTGDSTFQEFQLKGNVSQATSQSEVGLNATGKSIELDDVDPTKESNISLYGETYQERMEGKNLLQVENGTRDNISESYGSDVVLTSNGNDGTLIINGNTGSSVFGGYFGINNNSYVFEAGQQYTFTAFYESGSASRNDDSSFCAVLEPRFNNGDNFYLSIRINTYQNNITDTITVSSDTTLKDFYFDVSDRVIFNNLKFKLQIEKGGSSTPFEPYSGGNRKPSIDNPSPIENVTGNSVISITNNDTSVVDSHTIHLGNMELCKIGNNYDRLFKNNNIWYKHKEIEKIASYNGESISNGFISSTGELSTGATVYYVKNSPSVEEITDSTLLSDLEGLNTAQLYEDIKIESDKPTLNINYNVVKGSPLPDNPSKVKVVTGNNVITISNGDGTSEQEYPINLGNIELCKIGNYQDYFYKENDNWYKYNVIGKVVLNGTESSWLENNTTKGLFQVTLSNIYNDVNTINAMSNLLIGNNANNILQASGYVDNSIATYNSNRLLFRINNYANNLSGLKLFLSNNNLIAYYVLNVPTTIQITDNTLISQLDAVALANSYEGQTNITSTYNNNNSQLILNVSIYDQLYVTVKNEGNANAKPIFTVYGNGDIGVYLNNIQIFNIDLGNEGYITIDTNEMQAYKDSINVLKNRLVTGDYSKFNLIPGDNVISFSGNVNKMKISNYTRWI